MSSELSSLESLVWWCFCFTVTPTSHLCSLHRDKTVFEEWSTSLSLVTENWQAPGCAQGDCDFTSHSISNILLLWIKSSQSKSVSACACLFGKEMLFRGILFVIVVEQYDIKWAQYWSSAVSTLRFLTSTCFSFWPSLLTIRPADKLYFIRMHKYDVLRVFVTYVSIACILLSHMWVDVCIWGHACEWTGFYLHEEVSLFLLLPTLLYSRG